MPEPKDITLDLINEIYDGDYSVVAAGDDAPSTQEVQALAAEYGASLPEDYIVHATGKMGGVVVEVKEEIWPQAEEFAVAPFWEFCRGVYSFAFSEAAPDWLRIRVAADQFAEMGHRFLPVLKVWADPRVYCYDHTGKLARYDTDEDVFEPVEMDWFELLRFELGELADRKARKKHPGGE